ncbi:MAG: hypothetical protein EOP38_17795 [Rubrivivax sp.]|nr:MAG: hypothetical protein EOP38_17795 [Rubrivivax sp.]
MNARVPTAIDLAGLSFKETLALFAKLQAPALADMDGEYEARLLKQPSWLAQTIGQLTISNPLMPGQWLCKAFRPVNQQVGRGYNTFQHLGRTVQRFPMHTQIAPSRYDGRPAYQLVYRAYHSMCGDIHMVDEVRRVGPNLFLGIGTWGFSDKQRQVPLPFMLKGPIAPYRGDIGKPRSGFDPRSEIPALKKA